MIIILDGITYNVKYKKSNIGNYMRREVTLLRNKKIGRFVIEGKSNHSNHFNSGNPCSMSIGIDDKNYKGKGLSPIMIKYMIDNIKRDYPNIRANQYLYIDADASGGFWDSIGMEGPENGEEYKNDEGNTNEEGKGYEKRISFENLQKYVDDQLKKPKYKNMIIKSPMRTRSRRSLSPSRSPSRNRSRSPKRRSSIRSPSRNRSRSPKRRSSIRSPSRSRSPKRRSSIRSPKSYTRKKIGNI